MIISAASISISIWPMLLWSLISIGQMEILMDDDDNLSIEDEIEKDRRVFQNRRSGVSILQTYNLLEDFDFRR